MKQHLISPAGFEKLKQEWEDLKFTQRPQMVQQVQEAAAEGDRSENAAYTYGKMRLREIDRRLRYLDRLLDQAVIREKPLLDPQIVQFGSRVLTQENGNGRTMEYTLVGSAEIDPFQGKISLDSPIGKALKGKTSGDVVQLQTPKGTKSLTIQEVQYGLD